MFQNRLVSRAVGLFQEYPRTFWTLAVITFIDHIGGFLLYPFFALYLTSRFQVGMADVGVLFAVFSVSSFAGSTLGGALTDRFGRKGIIMFGLAASALSAVAMGFVGSFETFIFLAAFVGILTDVAGPARQAMVADLLPEEKRADGYGIIRVAFNLSAAVGPALGGFLASRSYLALFLADAAISLLAVALIWKFLPESRPEAHPDAPKESLGGTFAGYGQVFRNRAFLLFLFAFLLSVLAYLNMNTTLGVYLRDVHFVPTTGYGWLISMNALLVVLFQFPITRRIERYPPMLLLAFHSFLYALGFGMFGLVSTYSLFVVAMVIVTIGEMIGAPVFQAVVATFAPAEMRGRYMAVAGFSWGIPYAVGPYLAGLLLDGPNPSSLWYAAGLMGVLSALGFVMLFRTRADQPAQTAVQVIS